MKPERLSPLDSSYLSMDGPVTVGHVCLLCPFDGPVTMADMRARVEARIDRVPTMRRHLQTTLVGLGRPWWVDDPDFDLDQHLFEVTLSGEGDALELSKHVSRIATGRLNRAHPLWEFHLVQGIKGGSSALVTKTHHAVMDGIGVRDFIYDIFGQSSALSPDARPEQEDSWASGPWPSEMELVVRSLRDTGGWLGTMARFEYRATSGIVKGVESAVDGIAAQTGKAVSGLVGGIAGALGVRKEAEAPAESAPAPPQPVEDRPDVSWWTVAPESILNGPVSAARSYSFGGRTLAATRTVRHGTGTTINDVVIAATAGGLRRYLLERDALPDPPLISMIPIGGRAAPGRETVGGNRLALTLCTVPTHLDDPLERLYASHDAMTRAKNTPSMGEALLEDLMRLGAPGFTNLTVEAFYRLHLATRVRFPYNLMITNVPGSPDRLELSGHEITGLYPCPPLSDTVGLNVAAHGHRDRLCFGVTACPDLVPDVADLTRYILEAHDELIATIEPLLAQQADDAQDAPSPEGTEGTAQRRRGPVPDEFERGQVGAEPVLTEPPGAAGPPSDSNPPHEVADEVDALTEPADAQGTGGTEGSGATRRSAAVRPRKKSD